MSNNTLKMVATGKPSETNNEKPVTLAALLADKKTKAQMALALPKHMTADRLARIATTEIRKIPKLASSDQRSFLGAIMQCAQLGLEPGSAIGHAYLIPFDKREKVNGRWTTVSTETQLIIGYRGMIDLSRRSGQILSISARTVHENDKFIYAYGLEEKLEHIPCENGDRGAMTHVYAIARLKDGGVQFEVMSRNDIEKVRAISKAGDKGPWVDYFDEMAKKTVIRRLFKYLPVSTELQKAVILDEKAEAGISQDNAAIITGEYSVIEDDKKDHLMLEQEEARQQVEDILNNLDPRTQNAKENFAKAEAEIAGLEKKLGNDLYTGFIRTLDDMRVEYQ
ncbi:recombination and repair protein RecT [Sodalis glossinidius str. 'morsitans']|uniref:Phage recombinase n=1 Tax=Sodalis glossinidius (strain morsitans) TaxID=343509 RepID=Q2NTS5_SODGM|nr:recombination protein RecT [Sodalis glossinidius]BAE74450.1 phage recombinase [Sodalis glossinidius str. 'morsitans']CRL45134.1 recombination and repair protein RecT [Sodalis glossinidius str. 'morsitans']